MPPSTGLLLGDQGHSVVIEAEDGSSNIVISAVDGNGVLIEPKQQYRTSHRALYRMEGRMESALTDCVNEYAFDCTSLKTILTRLDPLLEADTLHLMDQLKPKKVGFEHEIIQFETSLLQSCSPCSAVESSYRTLVQPHVETLIKIFFLNRPNRIVDFFTLAGKCMEADKDLLGTYNNLALILLHHLRQEVVERCRRIVANEPEGVFPSWKPIGSLLVQAQIPFPNDDVVQQDRKAYKHWEDYESIQYRADRTQNQPPSDPNRRKTAWWVECIKTIHDFIILASIFEFHSTPEQVSSIANIRVEGGEKYKIYSDLTKLLAISNVPLLHRALLYNATEAGVCRSQDKSID